VEVVDTGATQLYNGKDYHPDGLQPLWTFTFNFFFHMYMLNHTSGFVYLLV
jgi:hypothetical protein